MTSTTVIGGGVVGLACALTLARAGDAVTVIEADATDGGASWGNAGHIAIEQVAPLASRAMLRSAPRRLFARGGALALPPAQWRAWGPFAMRLAAAATPARFAQGQAALRGLMAEAMPAWRRLAAALPDRDLLREDGHFVLWGSDATAAAGHAAWAAADIGTARMRDASADELALLAGLGARVAGAVRFEKSGQVTDLARLAAALRGALVAAGGRIVAGRGTLVAIGGRVAVSIDGSVPALADRVVVCAGVRSAALLAPLGHRAPIVAERGYHIRSSDHDWPAGLPPVVFEDRSMIVKRYDRVVQAASFVEPGFADAAPDPRKWDRLERHVAELGLPMRGPFARWMGARPTLPDYLPAIGRSTRAANLFYAFGHQHLGLTLAPVTGEIVAALAMGVMPAMEIVAFDIARFERSGR